MPQGQTAHWSYAATLWLAGATVRILDRNEVVATNNSIKPFNGGRNGCPRVEGNAKRLRSEPPGGFR